MRVLTTQPLRTILASTKPSGMLIPQLLPADGIAILTAAPKAGKTMLACQLALAVKEGKPFLGFGAGPASRVLYLDRESSRDELEERFKLLNADASDPLALEFCRESVQLTQSEDVEGLIACIKELGTGLVILDTLSAHIVGIDENDAGSVSRPLESLRRIQLETGVAILVVAHTPKSENHGKVASKTRGSNAITAVASTLMVLLSGSRKTARLAVERRFAPTTSYPLTRREDGFWAANPKGVPLKEAA